MTISLPSELVPFVDHLVATGEYANATEVVRDALSQLRDREAKFEALKASFDEAIEELDRTGGKPLDFEEIKRKGRERLATQRRE